MIDQPPSTAAPTPGPWEACERGAYSDFDGNSRVILGSDRRIAVVQHSGTPEDEANTLLIAAAPETAAERARLVVVNEGLVALLQEALPHVEAMANSLTIMTGPIVGPVDRLASEIQTALDEARKR